MSNRPRRKLATQQARSRAGAARPAQTGGGARLWMLLAGAVAVAIAAGIAIASSGGGNEATGEVEVGFAETIGASLPPYQGPTDTAALGAPAPTIRAQSMWSGDVVDVDVDNGRVQLVGFFAHWCPHCQREIPKVSSWLSENALPDGVDMVAVSTSVDSGSPNYPPSAWFTREGWTSEVLVDTENGALATGYGLSGFPYWVVVGPDGTVAERVSGEMTTEQFEAFIGRAADLAG